MMLTPQLFDRLLQTLTDIATPRVEECMLSFQLDLLREAGYMPELDACVSCGNGIPDGRLFFSPSRGGIICRSCETLIHDRIELDIRLLRIIQGIIRLPQRLPKLTRHQTDPINRMLSTHIEHTLSKRLRMTPYVIPARPQAAPRVNT